MPARPCVPPWPFARVGLAGAVYLGLRLVLGVWKSWLLAEATQAVGMAAFRAIWPGERENESMARWRLIGGALAGLFALIVIIAGALLLPPEQTAKLQPGARAEAIVVEKGRRRLLLMRGGRVLKTYRIALGGSPRGAKRREGDGRTPEGRYRIDWRNPASAYHLSLHVSYPDRADRERARRAGVSPGGMIMIHGLPNGLGWIGRLHRWMDWTNGCVAVTNDEIEELWRAVPDGAPVEIRP